MDTKKLSDLNSKMWYRLLKVLYFTIFAIYFLIFFIELDYKSLKNDYYNLRKSYINCYNGETIYLKNINLDYYDLKYLNYNENNKFKFACLSDKELGAMIKNESGVYLSFSDEKVGFLVREKFNSFSEIDSKMKTSLNFKEHQKNYILHTVKNNSLINVRTIFLDLIIPILIIIVFFELTKRIFYYVMLGTIKPKK